MSTREDKPPRGIEVRCTRRIATSAATAAVLAAVVALPWWVPALPAHLASVYDAAAGPAPSRPTAAPDLGQLVDIALDAVDVVPEARRPTYLPGRLASAGPPLRVRVPRLRVDAPVRPISGQDGELVPPADPHVLGWWQEGRPAGFEQGATVVTGHTVHTGGGVFDELGTLRRGDRFAVVTAKGEITYVVRWQYDYPTAELAERSHRLFSQDDFARLVLVTCSGWNGHGYDDSSVVLARPVAEKRSP